MRKIEIEIPEGKEAKWVDGVLTLVDEKPKDITDRIKTFEDAYHAGAENILNELAIRIEKAEIVNTKQVLEWIKEQTKE